MTMVQHPTRLTHVERPVCALTCVDTPQLVDQDGYVISTPPGALKSDDFQVSKLNCPQIDQLHHQ
jgi:hypothetical protein